MPSWWNFKLIFIIKNLYSTPHLRIRYIMLDVIKDGVLYINYDYDPYIM